MSVTIQSVLTGALQKSTASDASLLPTNSEVLTRVDRSQQRLFTKLADENRYFYVNSAILNSTAGASEREADLATLTTLVERLLVAKLPNGTQINQVDLQDLDAELAPRFYPFGTKMKEVGSDWGSSGAVALTVWYAYRPAALDLTGALTQLVTVPDRFCDYLELDLAIYVANKDFGRPEASSEVKRLTDERDAVFADYLAHLTHFQGPSSRRFTLPVPVPGEKA